MLRVDRVAVRFGSVLVVDSVSFDVADREVVALLGPSGSGKSTLLRAIAGLDHIESGQILFDGLDLAGVPTFQRGFGLMFQSYGLFPHMTVAANVGFGLRMAGHAPDDIEKRVGEVLAWVGLGELADRRVVRLSGGEQQRVALARTVAPSPRLLMFDEPVGALDRQLRRRLVEDTGHLIRESGASAIYVSHDHQEAAAISDQVVLIRSGRVVQAGTLNEIRAYPADAWVAEFIA
jgi:thiamine transport system ATP-binding protein